MEILRHQNYMHNNVNNVISPTQYEDFKKRWVFYALQELRYGQAFCNHFNIENGTPLYYFADVNICERWIKDNYLIKE